MGVQNIEGQPRAELFVQSTLAAQTNTVVLSGRLRPFWEAESDEAVREALAGQLKLDLVDVEGKRQPCEFVVDLDDLERWLEERIGTGVRDVFFTATPRAETGLGRGAAELRSYRVHFPAAKAGWRLFAQAIGPVRIALQAVAPDREPEETPEVCKTLDLEALERPD